MNTELISLKGSLPFRISTTSYVIPDTIVENVLFCAQCFDEVELVFFETSEVSNYPSGSEIKNLIEISKKFDLTYSIHLPSEIFLGDPDPQIRMRDCEKILRFYERTLSLDPTSIILHLDRRGVNHKLIADVNVLLMSFLNSLEYLQHRGMALSRVAVENLDFSLQFIEPIVEKTGMTYCLDVGHMIFYGLDLEEESRRYMDKSLAIHLHGVLDGMDHRSLEGIEERKWNIIKDSLSGFGNGVSIEVFSIDDLIPSLRRIRNSFLLGRPTS